MAHDTEINNKYLNIPLGLLIRKQIAKSRIFRIRPGNGYYGTEKGVKYQDNYTYFVPSSISNTEGEPYRANIRAAVYYWKYVIDNDLKQDYNKRAAKIGGLSGYNLFIKEALKGIYHMLVYRGSPTSPDWTESDLTTDNNWNSLDISSIVPANATGIILKVKINGPNAGDALAFRKYQQTGQHNIYPSKAQVAGLDFMSQGIVCVDNSQMIEYRASNVAWNSINITVCGWWV